MQIDDHYSIKKPHINKTQKINYTEKSCDNSSLYVIWNYRKSHHSDYLNSKNNKKDA